MTSGTFETVPIALININRDRRQRRELEGIDELKRSIADVGLINPPVITRAYDLVAGERRLTACTQLGWSDIPVQWADTLDEAALQLLELEENVRRIDLPWRDQTRAIEAYHALRSARDSFTIEQTAKALGVHGSHVSQHLLVAKALTDEPALLETADTFAAARNIASRRAERKQASAITTLLAASPVAQKAASAGTQAVTPSAPVRRASIEHTDFLEWLVNPPAEPFNLIHCDFPYGVSVGDKVGQSGAKTYGTYADSPDVYFKLLAAFCAEQDSFVAPSAHMIFWFSQKFYLETRLALQQAGWKVDPFLLIWHKSDNAGIIPDSQRGGRRTYETAFFCSRGDRKIVSPVAMSVSASTTKDYHTSEKPFGVLQHFFRMVLDDTSRVFDPTAGSGMAIRVAEEMGAAYALGLERDEEFAKTARVNCKL